MGLLVSSSGRQRLDCQPYGVVMQTIPECLKPTGPGAYRCSRLGFVVKTSALRIRCQCPRAIVQSPPKREGDDRQPIETVEQRIWRWIDSNVGTVPPSVGETFKKRIHTCLNVCEQFTGSVCGDPTIKGNGCARWKRWMKRIVFSTCKHWDQLDSL